MNRARLALLALAFAVGSLALEPAADAIRPFVTDDARVVGRRRLQLESWLLVQSGLVTLSALPAIGPVDWAEVTIGAVGGGANVDGHHGLGVAGPLAQIKLLVRPTIPGDWPGVAFAAGSSAPWGLGPVVHSGWYGFSYVALSQAFFGEDDLLLHLNLGLTVASAKRDGHLAAFAGFGVQARVLGRLCAVGEIYYNDPYDPLLRVPTSQLGLRFLFSGSLQFDATAGSTLMAEEGERGRRLWATAGVRVVSDAF